ncbi:MAG: zinc metallopeptidase [Rhodospirillales bacterium]|nr:MAG: zinc metallopeptidase [Rhodospirillales bacterium]
MLIVVLLPVLLAVVFGPQLWVRRVMRANAADRPDFPGTGGELARHLLDRAGLADVKVERVVDGDHYDSRDRAVRLSAANFDGRSVTAVAVAAHEVGHALQHAAGMPMFHWRQRLAGFAIRVEQVAAVVMVLVPVVAIATRAPALFIGQIALGIALLACRVVVHLATLPVEFDASFGRALPVLEGEGYLPPADIPAARGVLRAAALTYVAAALVSLLDLTRWIRVLRF